MRNDPQASGCHERYWFWHRTIVSSDKWSEIISISTADSLSLSILTAESRMSSSDDFREIWWRASKISFNALISLKNFTIMFRHVSMRSILRAYPQTTHFPALRNSTTINVTEVERVAATYMRFTCSQCSRDGRGGCISIAQIHPTRNIRNPCHTTDIRYPLLWETTNQKKGKQISGTNQVSLWLLWWEKNKQSRILYSFNESGWWSNWSMYSKSGQCSV